MLLKKNVYFTGCPRNKPLVQYFHLKTKEITRTRQKKRQNKSQIKKRVKRNLMGI